MRARRWFDEISISNIEPAKYRTPAKDDSIPNAI
jgi:hypothetical protein